MKIREQHLIKNIINKLDLNLNNLTVLTEVGSNNYIYTPLIALMAGAKKVYAWTRDSGFGKGEYVVRECTALLSKFNLSEKKIDFSINERPIEQVAKADIITNLGFIRPLDKDLLSNASKNVVIPYMCEAWEIRDGDIDLEYCRQNKIKVAGTWENHPDLLIFNGCAHLIAKLCFEAGFEIYQNKILIISEDHFGSLASEMLRNMNAATVEQVPLTQAENKNLSEYDFVLLADYTTEHNVFTDNILKKFEHDSVSIVHLSGKLNLEKVQSYNFNVYPKQNGYHRRMTRALDYLGAKPIIELHAAGLKVGENLYKNVTSSLCQIII